MSDPRMRLVLPHEQPIPSTPVPLGRMLVDAGYLTASDLLAALGTQSQADAPLGDLLVAQGLLTEESLYHTLASQHDAQFLRFRETPPDQGLLEDIDALACLDAQTVPWMRMGNVTIMATCNPAGFEATKARLPAHMHPVLMAVVTKSDLELAIQTASDSQLAERAEQRVPDTMSCRSLPARIKTLTASVILLLVAGFGAELLSMTRLYAGLFAFAITMVLVAMCLKCAGAALHLMSRTPIFAKQGTLPAKLPRISLLVPLNDEANILPQLLERLGLLRYPKELLDVLIIVEADDTVTRVHLEACDLPFWMRIVVVPHGQIQTKPRAMNYALPFCRGQIVGIYDAEDAPHPDQLRDVVATFASQPQSTACIQAVLDFYNARSNAMARFFAIEYAAWFRLILPGVARLGFAIPLGGTSVFFRKDALEALHGWDAHNVTEDADLGIRLARKGYRTVLINSVTLEEANNHLWPWVKQRSRWLKGYLITYLTHMRNPYRLLIELGLWKFLGFQAFFLSAISQYMLAPLIWSCMALYFGAPHFLASALPASSITLLMYGFIAMWLGSTVIYLVAISGKHHRHLIPWSLGMSVYLSLGTLAIYKGAWELLTRPFYWDKTAHGKARPAPD